jgi:hypothetical protein
MGLRAVWYGVDGMDDGLRTGREVFFISRIMRLSSMRQLRTLTTCLSRQKITSSNVPLVRQER